MDTKFKKGGVPWNRGLRGYRAGIERTKETKNKISATRKLKGLKPAPYKRNENVSVICGQCQKAFEVIASRQRTAKYCSKKCYASFKKSMTPYNKGVFKAKTYGAFHHKVRKIKGTPSKCEICGTEKSKKFEWANLTGNYEDVNDYKRMCAKCHRVYDNNKRKTK